MIKKIGIIAKNKAVLKDYKKEIRKAGYKYGLKNADLIISLGGDGTLLESERKYPKIPKLMIRENSICEKCNITSFDKFLDLISNGKFEVEQHKKLESYINGKKTRFLSVNDLMVRNSEITQAIRYTIYVDNKKFGDFIGDGLVISTPFGSTAYYESITKKSFKKGMGLALNNANTLLNGKVYDDSTKIKVIIQRGKAVVASDNYRQKNKVKPFDEIVVKLSKNNIMNLVKPLKK
ncbi:hypothetical protein C0585_04615 [Candidatus Woesearchaeota archaeon]|nr:MAG: hypothetical protein C0585_04615 [Candidatus Woesearchaeota archaeon]